MNTFKIIDGKVFVNDVEIKNVIRAEVVEEYHGILGDGTKVGKCNLVTLEFKAE